MSDLVSLSVEKIMSGHQAFCKLLSANDSGETGGHQSGFLISKTAKNMLFSEEELGKHIAKRDVKLKWQDDFFTDGCFTWYESKGELRITKFMRKFPFRGPDYTGALFVLIRITDEDYECFIFNTEAEMDGFLSTFGLTPAETNRPVDQNAVNPSLKEDTAIRKFINGLGSDEFPSSDVMSSAARMIAYAAFSSKDYQVSNPDRALLQWTDEEYKLFRALEQARYGSIIFRGFDSVDEFVVVANKVLNRRKSRAGKSLEHHLAAIFDGNEIEYTAQARTEGRKRPDFIFPSEDAYHDISFPIEKLTSLAAKTTCKDRWRQILNEADRLRDGRKYLCTLQQGISGAQMDEMEAEKVTLVVPKSYISTYPKDRQDRIWTIKKFVDYVKEKQNG